MPAAGSGKDVDGEIVVVVQAGRPKVWLKAASSAAAFGSLIASTM